MLRRGYVHRNPLGKGRVDVLQKVYRKRARIVSHRFREVVVGPDELFKAQLAGGRVESDNMQNATTH